MPVLSIPSPTRTHLLNHAAISPATAAASKSGCAPIIRATQPQVPPLPSDCHLHYEGHSYLAGWVPHEESKMLCKIDDVQLPGVLSPEAFKFLFSNMKSTRNLNAAKCDNYMVVCFPETASHVSANMCAYVLAETFGNIGICKSCHNPGAKSDTAHIQCSYIIQFSSLDTSILRKASKRS